MNDPSELERFQLLAAGFVVGNLDAREAAEFQALLQTHPEWTKEVEGLQATVGQVVEGFTETDAPPRILTNILEQIKAPTSVARVQRLRWLQVAGAVAAAAAIALGIDNIRLRQNLGTLVAAHNRLDQENRQLQVVKGMFQNPDTRLFSFKGTKPGSTAFVTMIINPQQAKALLMVRNLPAPPPGQMYTLWAVIADRKFPCGVIGPTPGKTRPMKFPFRLKCTRIFMTRGYLG